MDPDWVSYKGDYFHYECDKVNMYLIDKYKQLWISVWCMYCYHNMHFTVKNDGWFTTIIYVQLHVFQSWQLEHNVCLCTYWSTLNCFVWYISYSGSVRVLVFITYMHVHWIVSGTYDHTANCEKNSNDP
jgi:hypothetical protein